MWWFLFAATWCAASNQPAIELTPAGKGLAELLRVDQDGWLTGVDLTGARAWAGIEGSFMPHVDARAHTVHALLSTRLGPKDQSTSTGKQRVLALGSKELAAQRRPLVVLFFHIPKTGGESILASYNRCNPDDAFKPCSRTSYRELRGHTYQKTLDSLTHNATLWVGKHFVVIHSLGFAAFEGIIPHLRATFAAAGGKLIVFTQLRNPVDTALSFYNYYYRRGGNVHTANHLITMLEGGANILSSAGSCSEGTRLGARWWTPRTRCASSSGQG